MHHGLKDMLVLVTGLVKKKGETFKMENELKKLYNTLLLIETKGESTKIMADCIKFTEQLINRAHEESAKANAPKEISNPM